VLTLADSRCVAAHLGPRSPLFLIALIAAAFVTGCSSPKIPPPLVDPGHDLILTNATIVDTHDGHLTSHMTVTIQAGKIASIAPDSAQPPPRGSATPIIDAQGKFLVPGFVDAHVHVLGTPHAADDEALMLANGITAFRQMSGSATLLQQRRVNRLFASIFAPKLLAMPGEVLVTTNAFTPEEGVSEVDRQKAQGADFIKIALVPPQTFYAVGDESKKVGLPFEGHLPPGVDPIQAANAGFRSIEHLGPSDAILADCSTDEAALNQETAAHPMRKPPPLPDFVVNFFIRKLTIDPLLAELFFNPDTLSRMERVVDTFDEPKCRALAAALAKTGAWQVPTLIRLQTSEFADDPQFQNDPNLKYVSADVRKDWADVSRNFSKKISPAQKVTIQNYWQLQLKLARLLDEAGVPMLAGTDSAAGTAAGFNLHLEFALLARDGFTPLKILQMTTLNAAKFFGREETMGTVEAGRDADLVLLDANPVENSQNLDRINAVIRNGSYYSRATLDAKLRSLAH
jgi:imidazolonepropionase-like amidohydrolase